MNKITCLETKEKTTTTNQKRKKSPKTFGTARMTIVFYLDQVAREREGDQQTERAIRRRDQ